MTGERGPRPGTIQEKVWAEYQAGTPRHLIVTRTQLKPTQVANALAELREKGIAPQQSQETVRQHMIDSIRLGKESIWSSIAPFAQMGMAPREIQVATRLEQGVEHPKVKIENTVSKARNRGGHLARLSDEDRIKMLKVGYEPAQVIEDRAHDWLAVKNLLMGQRLHTVPQTRDDWLALINLLNGSVSEEDNQRIINLGNPKVISSVERASNLLLGMESVPKGERNLGWLVIYYAQDNLPPILIAQKMGISSHVVTETIYRERRAGRLFRPTLQQAHDLRSTAHAHLGNPYERTLEWRLKFSERKGGTLAHCLPLVLRKIPIDVAMNITGLSRRKVEEGYGNARELSIGRKPTAQETRMAIIRSHLGKPRAQIGFEYSQNQLNQFKFLKKYSDEYLFPIDLTFWHGIEWMNTNGRAVPQHESDKLRLEMHLQALFETDSSVVYSSEETPVERYFRFGSEVDQEWFESSLQEEQQFLEDFVGTIVGTEGTPVGKRLLLDLYLIYAYTSIGNEINSVRDEMLTYYQEKDPELFERITLHLDRIQKLAQL